MENKSGFVSLHNHSDYSLFDSICKYSTLIERAKELGMDTLGISEHGTTSGLLDFYYQCKKAGVKPILGCEFYISTNINVQDRRFTHHICIYAKDFEGYKNLNRLNSFAQQHMYYKPRISFAELRKHSKGLICCTACLAGVLNTEESDEYLRVLMDIFGDDLYLEFQFNTLEEQVIYNRKLMDYVNKFGLNTTIGIDTHYVRKEDANVHRYWKLLKEDDRYFTTEDYYLYGADEVLERGSSQFNRKELMRMIAGTREIADKCNCEIADEAENYPVYVKEGAYEKLISLVREGVKKRFGSGYVLTPEQRERLNTELTMIKAANYVNYFLIMWDLCMWADEEAGIVRGVGRGSVAGSFVSYVLGITGLDPIKHGLLFERFLHLERVTPCDKQICHTCQ